MPYFADGKSDIEKYAQTAGVKVVGLYDQGKDAGLMKLGNSKEGACVALCLRWLGCTMLTQDFWGTTFAGKDRIKDPGVLDRVMGWIAGCDSQTRNRRIDDLASNLGLSDYKGATISGQKWFVQNLKTGGDGLCTEVFDADCHCLIGLATGTHLKASTGSGHAIAFIKTDDGDRRFFDPNFGEFILSMFDGDEFIRPLWNLGSYHDYDNFSIKRFHPAFQPKSGG